MDARAVDRGRPARMNRRRSQTLAVPFRLDPLPCTHEPRHPSRNRSGGASRRRRARDGGDACEGRLRGLDRSGCRSRRGLRRRGVRRRGRDRRRSSLDPRFGRIDPRGQASERSRGAGGRARGDRAARPHALRACRSALGKRSARIARRDRRDRVRDRTASADHPRAVDGRAELASHDRRLQGGAARRGAA